MIKNKTRIILILALIPLLILGCSEIILGVLTIKNDSSSIIKIKINRFESNTESSEEFILAVNESIRIKPFRAVNTFANRGFPIQVIIYNEKGEVIEVFGGFDIFQISRESRARQGGIFSSERTTEYYTFIITDELIK
ncbi:MAG: hypothetical protein FWC36_05310 [Spirochaetes bacterium]|nr:hypothetical protein [Spirochaetota bacterium]